MKDIEGTKSATVAILLIAAIGLGFFGIIYWDYIPF